MAIDQREALIAAVRAQVEKEKAAKAAKLKKEQEAMQLSGAADAGEAAADHNKPKYKTGVSLLWLYDSDAKAVSVL